MGVVRASCQIVRVRGMIYERMILRAKGDCLHTPGQYIPFVQSTGPWLGIHRPGSRSTLHIQSRLYQRVYQATKALCLSEQGYLMLTYKCNICTV